MRRDWRNVLLLLALFLAGTGAAIARQNPAKMINGDSADIVHLTVEVTWGTRESPNPVFPMRLQPATRPNPCENSRSRLRMDEWLI